VKPGTFPRSRSPGTRRLLLAGFALNLLLVLPAWWRAGEFGGVWLAPEAWLVPALAALLPPQGVGRVLRWLISGVLAFLIVAGLFDALVQSVLGRSLNVFIDVMMLQAGFHLLDGSLGRSSALLAAVVVALAAAGVVWATARLLAPRGLSRRVSALTVAVCVLLLLAPVHQRLPGVDAPLAGLLARQVGQFERTRLARERLVEAASSPAFAARGLPGLAGRDVYLVFVESYGGNALDPSPAGNSVEALLERWQGRLTGAGLHAVSTRLEAPIRGGQSWLVHATVLSGLSIDNPLWYRMLLERDIDLLSEDFRATGHSTINVSPAIVRDWPEGRALGFEHVYAAGDLGYEGPPLGWVTMPDQFTLRSFTDRIRPRHEGAVFAQIALISSHWPWQPVVDLLDPALVGRGEIYDQWRERRVDPFSLMFDLERMRAAYARSLAYSLGAVFQWAAQDLPRDALLIVLGDHQPVSLVTGRQAGRSVPVHVISGERNLLCVFRSRGFGAGLWPPRSPDRAETAALRQWLREDFGAGPDATGAGCDVARGHLP
jgi:hypothetical protein